MNALERAIRAEDWDLAAHLLLVSVLRVADAVPPETLSALLDLLSEVDDAEGV